LHRLSCPLTFVIIQGRRPRQHVAKHSGVKYRLSDFSKGQFLQDRILPFPTVVVGYEGEEGKTRLRIWVGALLTLVRGDLWVGVASSCVKTFVGIIHCYCSAGQPVD
jgi:hypothetical protein